MPKQTEEGTTGTTQRGSRRTGGGSTAAGKGEGADTKGGRAGGASAETGATNGARGRGRSKQPDLRKDLRDFASARPQGWDHQDWLSFLESLKDRGHDIADRETIGMALERERLDLALSKVKGVGPQKRQALIERFGTVWGIRHADPDDLAAVAKVSPAIAEQIKSEVR